MALMKTVRESIVPGGDVVLQLQQLEPAPVGAADGLHDDATAPASPATTAATVVGDGAAIDTPFISTTTLALDTPPGSPLPVHRKSVPTPQTETTETVAAVQTVELVVSSNTLRLVSPVFDALLKDLQQQQQQQQQQQKREAAAVPTPPTSPISKKKKKGSAVGEMAAAIASPPPPPPLDDSPSASASAPYILALPEDDAAAMELLMRLVHFRLGDRYAQGGDGVRSGLPGPRLLERLAHVCDKYGCTGALQGIGETWVRENMALLAVGEKDSADGADNAAGKAAKASDTTQADLDRWSRLVVFAFVTDQPGVFADLCWQLVLHHTGPIATSLLAGAFSTTTTTPTTPISTDVSTPAAILAGHPLIPQDVTALLESRRLASCNRFYAALTEPLRAASQTRGASTDSTVAAAAVGAYARAVVDAGLLARDLTFSDRSVQQLLDGIDRLPAVGSRDVDLVAGLRAAKDDILGRRDAYTCLDCIRAGGPSRRCRVSHS